MNNLYDDNSGVIELYNKDFIKKGNKFKILNKNFKNQKGLIIIYAPWCKHCISMAPMMSEIAKIFQNRFKIGSINAENTYMKNDDLRIDMKIKQYPTLKYVSKSGILTNYTGEYDVNDLIHFICKKEKINCKK